MSGILEADVDAVVSRAAEFGFAHAATHLHDGWAMVEVVRDNG